MKFILAAVLAAIASTHNLATEKSTEIVPVVGDIMQCVQEKCPNEYNTCTADPKCGPALTDCQKKCGTGKSCWTFCLAGKGDSAATSVAKCAASNGCV